MSQLTNKELIMMARELVRPRRISAEVSFGFVACVLLAANNKVYRGVNIDTACGIGFCAEHTAIASMITDGESIVKKIVAVSNKGILPPCGRCREFMYQINEKNYNTLIIIGERKEVKLKTLLPYPWQEVGVNYTSSELTK